MKPHRASAAALAVVAAAALAATSTAQAAPTRQVVPAAKPSANRDATDQGAVAKDTPVGLRVYLAPEGGQDALDAAVAAVSTPGSASYGQYLSAAQYHAAYDASSATVAAVTSFVRSGGLKVVSVEPHARWVAVEGKASDVAALFATPLHQFSADGQTYTAPTAVATVPASVAGRIGAVAGLSTRQHAMTHRSSFPAAFVNGTPCSAYYGEKKATDRPPYGGATLPYAPCGYVPSQFRSAYEGATTLTGKGVTVAITDAYAAPTILQDANQYATTHGDAAFTGGQLTQSNAPRFTNQKACDSTGWYGEETLDVEAVHGMAPGANVLYYGAASCLDPDFGDTLTRVVDDNKASIVSNSWGDTEANTTPDGIYAYEQAFKQGALQGISFLFSSGDNGDELANTGVKQADYPSSDPYITAVGGTSTAIGKTGSLVGQTGWGTFKSTLSGTTWGPAAYVYGAGGGVSTKFAQPSYQAGVVPGSVSKSNRAEPDVAMDADPTTGMLVGETQSFPRGSDRYGEYRIGGTSLASPLMAGFQALRQQAAGGPGGFLNPVLYGSARGTITDVNGPLADAGNVRSDYVNGIDASGGMVYSVRTFNQDSSLGANGAVTGGWDSITGLGVPSSAYLSGH